ncbi:MAG TPA: thioredoxin domain-containing protein, partial [Tepidisphaeraceae bacterium]|nr:thioredoxin domain-containing protein [Tepidisphaeraceae bacterium]
MSTHTHTNRLAQETSPYLLQHAHNPVDWYPWGEEAFAAARSQNKPIFLSVGYSTCYWCHVMERQSFENEAIAAVMNEKFINIKVDREERPDVDQLYMTAVQVLTRHGGWPMSVFLLPDLRPFYGGTYFPPDDAHGRPGFPTLLRAIEDAYRNRGSEVNQTATQLVNILQQMAEPAAPSSPITIDDRFVEALVERSISDYEPVYGGFGGAPKFPRETLLEMLLVHQRHFPGETRMKKILHTLDAMATGGIRDHLGGGFHRYSTDAKWLVPHFEIMLYDNAMLAWCYVEAHRQTGEARDARIAREIFRFILRDMISPDGAFYTALDAEVDSQEGLNYLWTAEQVRRTLTDEPGKGMGAPFSEADAELFLKTYGLDLGPNFADPHHGTGRPDKNILYLPGGVGSDEDSELERMRGLLFEERAKRKQPLLDTKVITSWNALMIRSLAYGGQILKEPRYTAAASKAAEFLLNRHRTRDGGLYRTSRDGIAKYNGFIDDYAYLAQALLALHEATDDAKWRDHANEIMNATRKRFGDMRRGAFYFSEEGSADLIVRQKVASDSPLPSGNATAAMALLELGDLDAARNT